MVHFNVPRDWFEKKQTRGIKNVTLKAAKKFVGVSRSLLGRVIKYFDLFKQKLVSIRAALCLITKLFIQRNQLVHRSFWCLLWPYIKNDEDLTNVSEHF